MKLPYPKSVGFSGQFFDFGHLFGVAITVLINGRYSYRNAVRMFLMQPNTLPPQADIEACHEVLLWAFWRRLGAA